MATGLYIGSTSPYAGKNMLSLGIGLRLQKEGLRLGYMKPVGAVPGEHEDTMVDEDACFVQEVLGLEQPKDLVNPVLITQDFKMRAFSGQEDNHLERIGKAYKTLSANTDMMLVSGSGHMISGKYCGLDSFKIIQELGLKVVVIDRLNFELNYDVLIAYKEALGDAMLGAVINDIPASFMNEVTSVVQPFLERKGIPVLGILPHDPLMSSICATDLARCLGGRLVTAQEKANGMVESFLIGTMQVENFMTHFRRHSNAAVLVGGDRADVQLVAIEGNCPCIVLTGNLYPNDIILSRAETLGVPIIMVRDDTYSVAKKMEALLTRHKLRDIIKIRQGAQLISANLDFIALRKGLGL
ncbi:phosphotransacetylase family protein [Desulfovibrio cuneatus]|uniref:phosphotransacetylase family protein n=1 Tax=Desulfovibrio cuneatus TaxID=159728 RepID=UPI0004269E54|nr:DRTGG domain-containing protein [Desulfovibrio cuneatus]